MSHNIARASFSTFSLLMSALVLAGVDRWGFVSTYPVLTCLSLPCAALGGLQMVNRWAHYLPRPFAHIVHWIRALAIEACAALIAFPLRFTRHLPSHQKAVGVHTGRPILLIHGYLHNSSAWTYLIRSWAKQGMGPIYRLNLKFPFQSIQDAALQVKARAEEIAKETQRTDLILIGHSMGGLVSAWYALRVAPPQTVTDVVTIGSPLAGTHVAKIGLGKNAREMERGSALIEQIQKDLPESPFTRFYHVGTRTDLLVMPSSSATLEGGNSARRFVLEDVGHLTLLFSPRVAQMVAFWLDQRIEASSPSMEI